VARTTLSKTRAFFFFLPAVSWLERRSQTRKRYRFVEFEINASAFTSRTLQLGGVVGDRLQFQVRHQAAWSGQAVLFVRLGGVRNQNVKR
jgi:hypothetical protein